MTHFNNVVLGTSCFLVRALIKMLLALSLWHSLEKGKIHVLVKIKAVSSETLFYWITMHQQNGPGVVTWLVC